MSTLVKNRMQKGLWVATEVSTARGQGALSPKMSEARSAPDLQVSTSSQPRRRSSAALLSPKTPSRSEALHEKWGAIMARRNDKRPPTSPKGPTPPPGVQASAWQSYKQPPKPLITGRPMPFGMEAYPSAAMPPRRPQWLEPLDIDVSGLSRSLVGELAHSPVLSPQAALRLRRQTNPNIADALPAKDEYLRMRVRTRSMPDLRDGAVPGEHPMPASRQGPISPHSPGSMQEGEGEELRLTKRKMRRALTATSDSIKFQMQAVNAIVTPGPKEKTASDGFDAAIDRIQAKIASADSTLSHIVQQIREAEKPKKVSKWALVRQKLGFEHRKEQQWLNGVENRMAQVILNMVQANHSHGGIDQSNAEDGSCMSASMKHMQDMISHIGGSPTIA